MLMLTHTWVLREFLGGDYISRQRLADLYIYNILPDLLPLHEDITSEITHRPTGKTDPPHEFTKSRYIYFHLLIDDFAHFGEGKSRPGSFDPDSKGYAYVIGKEISDNLIQIYRRAGRDVGPAEAAYRSHVLIEMAFDLELYERDRKIMDLLTESMNFTLEERLQELSRTAGWFFGIDEQVIEETMNRARFLGNPDRLKTTMNVGGRVGLFLKKFRDDLDGRSIAELEELFSAGMDLTGNKEAFLKDVSGMLIEKFPVEQEKRRLNTVE
jgi:hypothetical protein